MFPLLPTQPQGVAEWLRRVSWKRAPAPQPMGSDSSVVPTQASPVPTQLDTAGGCSICPTSPSAAGKGLDPPTLPKPALRRPSVPRHGSGASGRLRPGRFHAGRTDSDPTRVQSSSAQPSQPCCTQLPYGASQGRHAPRHSVSGTAPHPSPCRIPPPHRGGSMSLLGGATTRLCCSRAPGMRKHMGALVGGAPSLSPAAGGRDRAAAPPSPHPQTRRRVDFFPSSPHPNADKQLTGVPLSSPGSHARPAERVCMAQIFSPCKVSFQAGIPPAFGFT